MKRPRAYLVTRALVRALFWTTAAFVLLVLPQALPQLLWGADPR